MSTGPEAMQTGDQIWILCGAKAPLLLRPVAGEIGRYQLLGRELCAWHNVWGGYKRGEERKDNDASN